MNVMLKNPLASTQERSNGYSNKWSEDAYSDV